MQFFSNLNNIVGVITPFILLGWFIYTQRQNFYSEFLGTYAGFSPQPETEGYRVYGGAVIDIRDIVSSGYFRGEAKYKEIRLSNLSQKTDNDGRYFFYGDIEYNFIKYLFKRNRNPFKKSDNRVYVGTVYFVDRLDLEFGTQNIDTFFQAKGKIFYYRDYRAIEMKILERSERIKITIPDRIFLHKDVKLEASPLKDVEQVVFTEFPQGFSAEYQG